jgi:pilus assembly protein CpaB
MTTLDMGALSTQSMPKDKAPARALSNVVQAVGKILSVPVLEGQAISQDALAPEGTGTELAAQLPKGMRAVAVTVSNAGGLSGILYPGCAVDVLVAIKRTTAEEAPQTISTVLVENVPVLAVDQQTIVTPRPDKKKADADAEQAALARTRDLKVTLRVDVQQAKALQLGQDVGTLSLALRNPLDTDKNPDIGPVSLRVLTGGPDVGGKWDTGSAVVPALLVAAPKPAATAPAVEPPAPELWQTTIIRGDNVETRTFAAPATGTPRD